jgi:protein arginine kinase activator
MKCDHCNRPAVVHEMTVRSGVKREVHLCEDHAREAGFTLPGHQPIEQLLTPLLVQKSAEKSGARKLRCRGCNLTFSEFRSCGILGCAQCYDSFESQLGPMIERAQNGGTSHSGKCPHRGGGSIDRMVRLQGLMRELEEAVAAEQYERAADLRDRLRQLQAEVGSVRLRGQKAAPER